MMMHLSLKTRLITVSTGEQSSPLLMIQTRILLHIMTAGKQMSLVIHINDIMNKMMLIISEYRLYYFNL